MPKISLSESFVGHMDHDLDHLDPNVPFCGCLYRIRILIVQIIHIRKQHTW